MVQTPSGILAANVTDDTNLDKTGGSEIDTSYI